MLEVDDTADLEAYLGKEIGVSEWVTVDQKMIDAFAEATGDHQWIHVDTARAAAEMPDGKTIAHGYLTLSLIPRLLSSMLRVRSRKRGINYGINCLRFTGMVPEGARVRMRARLKSMEPTKDGGFKLVYEDTIEIEGSERPACIAEVVNLVY